MMLTLTLRTPPTVPLEADAITPDVIAALSLSEVRALPVMHGRLAAQLGDFFQVEGDPGAELLVRGDLARVKSIGRGMTRGRIAIEGTAGMHLGAEMRGGAIEVFGDAADWLGAEMRGGSIRVHGNAGCQVGAAYRGGTHGMRGGAIHIDGTVGVEVGRRMRRGLIVIGSKAGDYAGLQMKGGTLCLLGGAGVHPGTWMTRGTVISLTPAELTPTFTHNYDGIPVVLQLLARNLATRGVLLPVDERAGRYRQYSGDFRAPGRGEIFVWQPQ
jgi:formylmethanofuran dehydrogenase subunit C